MKVHFVDCSVSLPNRFFLALTWELSRDESFGPSKISVDISFEFDQNLFLLTPYTVQAD